VDLPPLIQALHQYFRSKGCLQDEIFDHAQLHADNAGWQYRTSTANRVIFCEGTGLVNNPWFKHWPLTPAKGETLILHAASLELPQTLYHHKKWILPYGDGTLRLGATYDEADASPEPTQKGYDELFEAARSFIRPEHALQVQAHYAGHRPTTPDARPMLGQHHKHPGLYLLNGLGSKGASLAPSMSRILLDHIATGAPLPAEIDLRRFV
jgi:glycine/D-amino acid oxidase-like deaminating enzyme